MTTATTTNPQEAKLAAPAPQPKYNGHLFQVPDHLEIYLVLNGYLRHVPDWETFQRLFKNAPIEPARTLDFIPKGPALTKRTMLIRGDEVNKTYLLIDKVKMWIPNPTIFEQYHFDMAQCCVLPQFVVDFITNAPDNVEGPHQ